MQGRSCASSEVRTAHCKNRNFRAISGHLQGSTVVPCTDRVHVDIVKVMLSTVSDRGVCSYTIECALDRPIGRPGDPGAAQH